MQAVFPIFLWYHIYVERATALMLFATLDKVDNDCERPGKFLCLIYKL